MTITPAKQVRKYTHAFVGLSGFTAAGGTSDILTTALTTVLATAGDAGLAVPLQVGSSARSGSAQQGIGATAPFNVVTVYDGVSGLILTDGNGHDVYGRVTNAGAVWTLSYFSAPGGSETAFAMPAGQVLAFDVPYVFDFDHLPATAFIGIKARHAAPDPAAYGWREKTDALTVTGANALSALSVTPDGRKTSLNINGAVYPAGGASPAFTVAGTTVTWSAANAGFALDTSDVVFATYTY